MFSDAYSLINLNELLVRCYPDKYVPTDDSWNYLLRTWSHFPFLEATQLEFVHGNFFQALLQLFVATISSLEFCLLRNKDYVRKSVRGMSYHVTFCSRSRQAFIVLLFTLVSLPLFALYPKHLRYHNVSHC